MAWYYYSGSSVRPIPVRKGRSVAVRPHTKFEVFEETREVQDLVARGVIRRSGAPPRSRSKEAEAPGPVPKIIAKDIPLPQFARSVAEKGVTSGRGIPPRSSGPVEMTEDEAHAVTDVTDENKGKKGKK